MNYRPIDIYQYIVEKKKEVDFLQMLALHRGDFTIGEIPDRKWEKKDGSFYLCSELYGLKIRIEDEDIFTALNNGLYVSAFLARKKNSGSLHFLVHQYPVSMKGRFENEILQEVIRYLILTTITALRLDTPEKADAYLNAAEIKQEGREQ